MGKKYAFRYIVIGGGPAGSSAALTLAKAKKSVALIEGRFFGGSNLNTRDIPYTTALHTAQVFHSINSSPEFTGSKLSINLPAMLNHRLKTIISVGGNDTKPYEDAGVSCIKGYATLLDAHTVAVGNKQFTADRVILATGAKLNRDGIIGADSVKILTPETALNLRRLPKVALVVGGGATGIEIAEYYAKLGVKVILMEEKPRILSREDREVSAVLANHLTNKLGATILTNTKVVAIENYRNAKQVTYKQGNSEKSIHLECVILATGSKPVLDYGLENAKVKYNASGVIVDKNLTTSAKNIFAVGDCVAGSQDSSTDRANYEGFFLASNLTGKNKTMLNYSGFIRQINTTPSVATIGYNEVDLIAKKIKAKKAAIPLSEITAAKTSCTETGFIKLFADANRHILGATIVAPHAELIIEEIALAMRHHLTVLELAATPHAINSLNYIVKLAAKKVLSAKRTKLKEPKPKAPKRPSKKARAHASKVKKQIKKK